MGEEFVGGHAPSVDVGPLIHGFAFELFGRHIGGCAGDLGVLFGFAGYFLSGIEIDQAHVAVE